MGLKLRPFDALRLYCEQRGYPAPVPEHRFHPTRLWRFDAVFLAEKVAVEFHGGVWTRGRHLRAGGFTADREKMAEAQLMGWRVLETTSAQVADGTLFSWLDRALGGTA